MQSLTPLVQQFVLHFGEMGSRWGINRTVGQIYALLYVSARPLTADDLVAALGFSRSNVSMGIKELQAWELVRLHHVPNDRRDHFSAPEDIWTIFRTLVAQRRKREIDPTLHMLGQALAQPVAPEDAYAKRRLQAMHDFIATATGCLDQMQQLDQETAAALMKMGQSLQKLTRMASGVKRLTRSAASSTKKIAKA
jgi:DNA-binding transcriptional regulator GbsR (MarR family)